MISDSTSLHKVTKMIIIYFPILHINIGSRVALKGIF